MHADTHALAANRKSFFGCDAPPFSLGDEFEELGVKEVTNRQSTSSMVTSVISPLGPSPPRKTIRRSSPISPLADTKKKSGEYLFNKRSTGVINLNDTAAELEFTQSPVNRKVVREGRIICPPRDTSRPHSATKSKAASEFYKWAMNAAVDPNRRVSPTKPTVGWIGKLNRTTLLKSVVAFFLPTHPFMLLTQTFFCLTHRYWVRHGSPKFIEISMAQLTEQFTGKHSYEPDTCDALLRRFQQMSYNGVAISWRHYLETDFAVRTSQLYQSLPKRS
jgi:hypothetical protein